MLDKAILSIFRVDAKLKILFLAAIFNFKMGAIETAFYGEQGQRSLKRPILCS